MSEVILRQDGRLVGGVCKGAAWPSWKDTWQRFLNIPWYFKLPAGFGVTFEGFQMLHSLPQDCEFVKFSSHGLAGRDHGSQLINEVVHFIPPTLFNLTVRLPVGTFSYQTICTTFLPAVSVYLNNAIINKTAKVIMGFTSHTKWHQSEALEDGVTRRHSMWKHNHLKHFILTCWSSSSDLQKGDQKSNSDYKIQIISVWRKLRSLCTCWGHHPFESQCLACKKKTDILWVI